MNLDNISRRNLYSDLKKEYIAVDIIRIVSASIVFMFHTTIHLGCNYWLFQGVSTMGAVFMTMFFIVSGFCLITNWGERDLSQISEVKKFWKRRAIRIFPLYWFLHLVYTILMIVKQKETIMQSLAITPAEIFGIQSFFTTLFSISHNSGTWFISCLLFCYMLYPFFQELIKSLTDKKKALLLLLCIVILLYASMIVKAYGLSDIYSNCFFRFIEFLIGMIIASLTPIIHSIPWFKHMYNWLFFSILFVVMFMLISFLVNRNFEKGNYMLYSSICIPCFLLIIVSASGIQCKRTIFSRVTGRLSAFTYSFFLAQLFSNIQALAVIEKNAVSANNIKIMIAWMICVWIALIFHSVEIVLNRLIRRYEMNSRNMRLTD